MRNYLPHPIWITLITRKDKYRASEHYYFRDPEGIPHTKAVANGRYLAGLLTWNGLVKSEGLATPSFFFVLSLRDFWNTRGNALLTFSLHWYFQSGNVSLDTAQLPVYLYIFFALSLVFMVVGFLLDSIVWCKRLMGWNNKSVGMKYLYIIQYFESSGLNILTSVCYGAIQNNVFLGNLSKFKFVGKKKQNKNNK